MEVVAVRASAVMAMAMAVVLMAGARAPLANARSSGRSTSLSLRDVLLDLVARHAGLHHGVPIGERSTASLRPHRCASIRTLIAAARGWAAQAP